MKTLIAVCLLCGSVFGADASIKVTSTTKTNPESKTASTHDTVTRDGKTILIRETLRKNGDEQIRIHSFYYAGLLVGTFTAQSGSSGFVTKANIPVAMSIEFGPSNTLKSVVIGSKDGVIFEWFSYSNGIFSPVDRSVIQKTNAFSSDVKQLFKPEHIKSTTPQRFGDEAQELVEKYQKSKK